MSDADERKRRGIDRTAAELRQSVVRNGGKDPGHDAARDRVRQAVERKDKQREQG
jgi:hypothetical protein